MLPTATLKKKSIKKREDESLVRKMQELMSSRPCGTLLNILNIVWGVGWGGMKTASPNLKPGSLFLVCKSFEAILLNYLPAF